MLNQVESPSFVGSHRPYVHWGIRGFCHTETPKTPMLGIAGPLAAASVSSAFMSSFGANKPGLHHRTVGFHQQNFTVFRFHKLDIHHQNRHLTSKKRSSVGIIATPIGDKAPTHTASTIGTPQSRSGLWYPRLKNERTWRHFLYCTAKKSSSGKHLSNVQSFPNIMPKWLNHVERCYRWLHRFVATPGHRLDHYGSLYKLAWSTGIPFTTWSIDPSERCESIHMVVS